MSPLLWLLALPALAQEPAAGQGSRDPWLVRHQEQDGRWDADGYLRHSVEGDPEGAPGAPDRDVRVTALSLLTLMEQDSDLTSGPDRRALRRGFEWLRRQRSGTLDLAGDPHPEQVRDHAIATVALVELLSLNQDPNVRATARDWVNALELARRSESGWPASRDADPDALTTGWAILALRDARRAGLAVSQRALRDGAAFQRACFDVESGLVAMAEGESAARLAPTGLALVGAFLAGRQPEDEPWLARARAALHAAGPQATVSAAGVDAESGYTGTMAAYLCGGRFWEDWSAGMKSTVLDLGGHAGALPVFTAEPGGTLGGRGWLMLQRSVVQRTARVLVR